MKKSKIESRQLRPKVILVLALVLHFICAYSQNEKTDSLTALLKITDTDSLRVNLLNKIAWELCGSNIDTAITLSTEALELSQKQKWLIGTGNSLHELGWFNYLKGNYSTALDFDFKALAIWDKLENEASGEGKQKFASGRSATLCNIGVVYDEQGDYPKAIDYYSRVLKFGKETGNKSYQGAALLNLGIIHMKQNDYAPALQYYLESLKLKEQLGDKKGTAQLLGNIGIIYMEQENYPEAMDYYKKSLDLKKETGNIAGTSATLGNIGELYVKWKKPDLARNYLEQALVLAKAQKDKEGCKDWYYDLSVVDSMDHNYKGALDNYKSYVVYRDSISNEENIQKQTQTEMQYEFDKKESKTKAEQDKKDTLTKIIIYSISGGLFLVLLLAVFIFRSYRQKRNANIVITKQKQEVEKQKMLVEEKQKEILDSIHYAKRIQRSLLPTEKYIEKVLKRLANNDK